MVVYTVSEGRFGEGESLVGVTDSFDRACELADLHRCGLTDYVVVEAWDCRRPKESETVYERDLRVLVDLGGEG